MQLLVQITFLVLWIFKLKAGKISEFATMEGLPFYGEKTNLHEISDIIGIFREYYKKCV